MTYDLGVYAYRSGKTIETNPFKDDTQEAKDFAKGWRAEKSKAAKTAQQMYKKAKRCSPN